MNDLAAVVTAIAALVAAGGAVIATILGYRNNTAARRAATAAEAAKEAATVAQAEIIATKDGVFEVGKQIDGRLSMLLEATRKLAHSEGFTEGEQAERDRSSP